MAKKLIILRFLTCAQRSIEFIFSPAVDQKSFEDRIAVMLIKNHTRCFTNYTSSTILQQQLTLAN